MLTEVAFLTEESTEFFGQMIKVHEIMKDQLSDRMKMTLYEMKLIETMNSSSN